VDPERADHRAAAATPIIDRTPDHAYDRSLETGLNPFATHFGDLSDQEWLEVLQRSISEPVIDGIEFPGFPDDELQTLIHGHSREQALLDAWQFYCYSRDSTYRAAANVRDKRLLDFGAGWGRIARMFMRDFDSANLYGYEPNQLFCTIARALNPYACFLHGPRLPSRSLPPAWFDLVVGYSVFSHLPAHAAQRWLAEIDRALRPGGWCVLTTWGHRFLERLVEDDARQRRGEPIAWHPKICIEAAGDLDARMADFERGEFVFLGESELLYGDAVIPEAALRRLIGEGINLELVRFDTTSLAQDAFVLTKRGSEGL
jgi:SAM-dependent methyltransferase